MRWNEAEGLLTYRARKIYSFVPELSAPGYQDPDNIFVTGEKLHALNSFWCFYSFYYMKFEVYRLKVFI